jgi:hypothetical protein
MRKLCIGVLALASCAMSFAEEISYSMNFKVWNNAVKITNPSTDVTTASANSPIVGFSVRKGDYFASASFMLDSSYRYQTVWLNRKDNDFSLGYRLNDNISVLGGYRSTAVTDGSQSNWVDRSSIYYIGASGFKQVADKVFLYGNLAYGSLTNTNDYETFKDGSLITYEAGGGYALNSSTQLVAGYRNQDMSLYNITRSRQEKNSIGGLVIGLNVNF